MEIKEEMLRLLAEIEFVQVEHEPGEFFHECPSCGERRDDLTGHAEGCKLASLKKRLESEQA